MKKCSKCGIEKELSFFNKHVDHKDGLSSHCKPCRKEYSKKYYEEVHQYRKPHYERMKRYGLSEEDYILLYTTQSGCCAICGIHDSDVHKGLFVDHNHYTGEIRGLLCGRCNTAIGMFQDDTKYLRNAINYLN